MATATQDADATAQIEVEASTRRLALRQVDAANPFGSEEKPSNDGHQQQRTHCKQATGLSCAGWLSPPARHKLRQSSSRTKLALWDTL